MPVTISGDGGIAGVSSWGPANFANTGTLTTSGDDVTICPQAAGRASIFVDDSANRVGINTTVPGQLVHISQANPIVSISGTADNVELQAGTAGGTAYVGTVSSDRFDIRTNNSNVITVLTNGNVGISTTSPDAQLHLSRSAGGSVGPEIRLFNGSGSAADKARLSFFSGISQATSTLRGALDFDIDPSGFAELIYSNSGGGAVSERFRIDANGNVGIGTNNTVAHQRLTVSTGSEIDGTQVGISIGSTAAVAVRRSEIIKVNDAATRPLRIFASTSTTDAAVEFYHDNTNLSFTVTQQGNIAFPNGQGIDFSASQQPGASSSVLDDYEEGTFVPTFEPTSVGVTGFTDSGLTCSYTKVGQNVTLYILIGSSTVFNMANTQTAYIQFNGLPFNADSSGTSQATNGAISAQAPTATCLVSGNAFYMFGFNVTANIVGSQMLASVSYRTNF